MSPVFNPLTRLSPAGEVVRLVQITDTHLCAEPGGTLLDMDTDRSLQLVLEQVCCDRGRADALLCTGDLSDRGYQSAYRRLVDYLAPLETPSFWLPGNHDDRAEMLAAVHGHSNMCGEIRAGAWQIVMLNSQIPGEVGGHLGGAELSRLRLALEATEAEGVHSLVCLHHQPVAIGSRWIDQQMVADAEAFWAIVDNFSGVRGVLWGHVHQEIDRWRGDVRLLASPSTCVQFAPNSERFRVDDKPPGYRWLELAADGSIASGVARVTDAEFTVDLESGGYL